MKCLSCQNFSLTLICKKCQDHLLQPRLYKRELEKDFFVYSFYRYDEIQDLINLKYEPVGNEIFKLLSRLSLHRFLKNLDFQDKLYLIPVDDRVKENFSHTAVLAHYAKSDNSLPLYGALRAKNNIKYAGKNLEFRQKHKRDFSCTVSNLDIVLIDDLVTTGTTLLEAKKVCEKYSNHVVFGLVLCDVGIK
jgi:competence protein ComFC